MKTNFVTEFSLMRAIEKTESFEYDEVFSWMQDLATKQPFLFGYLLACEELFEDALDFQNLLQITVIVWLSFEHEYKSIPKVSGEDIDRYEEKAMSNFDELEELVENGEMGKAFDLLGQDKQPVMLHFVAEELASLGEDEGEGEEYDEEDESTAKMYAILKLIIDLLDDAVNKPRLRVV